MTGNSEKFEEDIEQPPLICLAFVIYKKFERSYFSAEKYYLPISVFLYLFFCVVPHYS